jgi:hypothetical protein
MKFEINAASGAISAGQQTTKGQQDILFTSTSASALDHIPSTSPF